MLAGNVWIVIFWCIGLTSKKGIFEMRNFRELEIWKESVDLTVSMYSIVKSFPNNEKYGLVSQMNRCSVSIASNIAEGCRGGNKELVHFLNIALGSSFELETQLEIANRIGFIDKEIFDNMISKLNILQKRINSFRTSIKRLGS